MNTYEPFLGCQFGPEFGLHTQVPSPGFRPLTTYVTFCGVIFLANKISMDVRYR